LTPADGGRDSTTLSERSDSVVGHKKDPGDVGMLVGETLKGIGGAAGAKDLCRDDLMRERSRPREPLPSDEAEGIPGGTTATN
jgi:hypothetical protein